MMRLLIIAAATASVLTVGAQSAQAHSVLGSAKGIVDGKAHIHVHARHHSVRNVANKLRDRGYYRVRYTYTGGRGNYHFIAWRNGKKFDLRVNPRNAVVLSRTRLAIAPRHYHGPRRFHRHGHRPYRHYHRRPRVRVGVGIRL